MESIMKQKLWRKVGGENELISFDVLNDCCPLEIICVKSSSLHASDVKHYFY